MLQESHSASVAVPVTPSSPIRTRMPDSRLICRGTGQNFFFCFRMECPPGCPEIIYQIMRSCWKWDPSDRPNFWEIHHSLVSLLQPIQYYEEEEFIEPPIVPSFVTNDVASQGKYAEHDICQCNPLGTLG